MTVGVLDATVLQRDLELTLELCPLGKPLLIALEPLRVLLERPELAQAFQVPLPFLLMPLAENNDY